MKELAPELTVKMSVAIGTAAIAASQKLAVMAPITFLEMAVAALGGFVAGLALLRFADPAKVMGPLDKAYTVLFSLAIGWLVGPPVANYFAKLGWVGEGLWENATGGLLMGAVVPLSFGTIINVLRWGQRHPDRVEALIRDLWPWGRK